MTIRISNEQERKMIAGILVANGYTVKIVKIKVGKTTKTALEIKEEEGK